MKKIIISFIVLAVVFFSLFTWLAPATDSTIAATNTQTVIVLPSGKVLTGSR